MANGSFMSRNAAPTDPVPSQSYVDLHIHTNRSDGTDAPTTVVERAAALGLAAIAITDHDTVAGVEEARHAAYNHDIEFLSGIEISASFGRAEVHVVGLGINTGHTLLVDALRELREGRDARINKMIDRLNRLGIDLTRAEVEALSGGGVLARLHVARALVARGVTQTTQQGFDKYIGAGRKAYVPKKTVSCFKAIDLIHGAGGLAVLAHPGVGSRTEKILDRLLELPFDGIEIYHTRHTQAQTTRFIQVALERDLLISGGSDCHGTAVSNTPDLGNVRVPYHHFEAILSALRQSRGF